MMKKNYPILVAGGIMCFTTILHLTGGQVDHVVPLLDSDLSSRDKAVWIGVWHMVTVILLGMSIVLIMQGIRPKIERCQSMFLIAWLNILFAAVFIVVSLVKWEFAPQWILFLPIGLLIFWGGKSISINN